MHSDCPLVSQELKIHFNFYDLVKTSKVTSFRRICIYTIQEVGIDWCYIRKTTVRYMTGLW
jgi:hypothetical protein